MKRGDIVLCDFGKPIGHEPGLLKPAVVLSVAEINNHDIAIVAPVTRTKRGYPTHVEFENPLPVTSYIQCELLRAVSRKRIIKPLGRLDEIAMMKVGIILRRIMAL